MEKDYNQFLEIYEKNKSIIKENSYKTIKKFMTLFSNFSYSNIDNKIDFLIDNKILFKFNEENNILENIEKEYLSLIYISLKKNIPESFYEKLFLYLINSFNPTKIFLNAKFFKKCFKFICKNIKTKNTLEIINLSINDSKEIEINNKNKNFILIFLYYYYFYNINNDIINLEINNINFDYIKFNFELTKILNLYIIKQSQYISCQNYFNYLFNKHFFAIKKLSQEKNNNLFYKLLDSFLLFISIYESKNHQIYENFLYIISFLLCPTNEEDVSFINNFINVEKNKEIIDKIKNDILISNNSILHQISINLLNKNEKKLNEDFMKKYISIYDVLDGFNCHLFKSLEPQFKSILLFINDNNDENKNEYFNLFILLNRKVFNHDNSRIHKFFIKTICKIENLDNEIFSKYLFNDFLENINSPMLYPENERNIYHNKVGILINSFLIKYLNKNKKLLFDFIHGLSKYVNNYKIIPYLFNVIDSIIINSNNNYLEGNKNETIIEDILKIIENLCKGNSSQYKKYKNYDTIGKLLINILSNKKNYLNEQNIKQNLVYLIKIYSLFFEYLINFNKDVLSIELLNLSDIQIFDKKNIIYNVILGLINLLRNYILVNDDFNEFLNNPLIKKLSPDIINLLFFSLNNNEILNSFLISNEGKLFSDYLNIEQKKEYLSKFTTILYVQKVFIQNKKENLNNIKELFDNIFSTLKNFAESNNDIKITKELFEQYENLLFYYINTYSIGFNDILFNNVQFTLNSNNFFYRLLFIKMYLFQYLTCIHFKIFDSNNKSSILENNILKNNLISIINYLLNNESNINEFNKIIFLKCLILCLISLKTLNYNEISNIFEKIENNNNSKLNLDFFYNFLDILSLGDLFYGIKFFNIYFDTKYINDENEEIYLKNYKLFIDKCTKVILEKRENFTFLNIMTFVHTFLNKKFLINDNFISLVVSTLKQLIDLNENRIWLLLKISTEVFLNNIQENILLLDKYQDIIIELSTIKETRGDDSFMIQTSPYYIKSPFNLKIKKILPYDERISKYGLYIRFSILYFLENLIKNYINKENEEKIINIILEMILKIIEKINNSSGIRPEMIFTEKHREKLRLSQLLVTLGSIFNLIRKEKNEDYIKNFINIYKNLFEAITKNLIDLFNKTNLQSVDFYVFNFNLQFLYFSPSLRNYYLDIMTNPKSKSHMVSAFIIIISISILENVIRDKNEIIKFIDAITILCTSNVCNVRGFGQFFLDKIFSSEEIIKKEYIVNNNINKSFIIYLKRNQNIQKFFSKFEEKYKEYIRLLKDFSTENLLKDNLDEVYCEIVPLDIIESYKILSSECLVIDNIDYGKVTSNWRFAFDTNEEIEKILNKEDRSDDFQKKYRPLDINIYHDMNHKRKRHDIIVVGSLIDKAPNLGGLTRTCEIFNIGALTIPNESFLKDVGFLRAAASGEKWTPLLSVPPCTVKEFIISYKKLGYTIIGLEQTQNSINIKDYKFHEKTIIVLGNEKQGIPQDIINLIDNCIIIPQYGHIRSLNVHVSAAIMLWEAIQCLNNQ